MFATQRCLQSSDSPNCASVRAWQFASVFVLGFLAGLSSVSAAVLSGKVVSVHDGDTITVLDEDKHQHRIRLAGIDAPELGQAFGRASREHLAGLVAGKQVSVEWQKHDKYRRVLGKVLVDGVDANLEQLRAGMAWHYRKYESEQSPAERKSYDETERNARATGLGLWQDRRPQPPWEYRQKRRPIGAWHEGGWHRSAVVQYS